MSLSDFVWLIMNVNIREMVDFYYFYMLVDYFCYYIYLKCYLCLFVDKI